jgi:hypothetical protein
MVKSKKNKSTGGSKKVIETALKNKTLDLSSYIKGKDLSTKIKSKIDNELKSVPINCSKLYGMKDMMDDYITHKTPSLNKLKSDLTHKYDSNCSEFETKRVSNRNNMLEQILSDDGAEGDDSLNVLNNLTKGGKRSYKRRRRKNRTIRKKQRGGQNKAVNTNTANQVVNTNTAKQGVDANTAKQGVDANTANQALETNSNTANQVVNTNTANQVVNTNTANQALETNSNTANQGVNTNTAKQGVDANTANKVFNEGGGDECTGMFFWKKCGKDTEKNGFVDNIVNKVTDFFYPKDDTITNQNTFGQILTGGSKKRRKRKRKTKK